MMYCLCQKTEGSPPGCIIKSVLFQKVATLHFHSSSVRQLSAEDARSFVKHRSIPSPIWGVIEHLYLISCSCPPSHCSADCDTAGPHIASIFKTSYQLFKAPSVQTAKNRKDQLLKHNFNSSSLSLFISVILCPIKLC